MHEKAVKLGGEIIQEEKNLDAAFSGGAIDQKKLTESLTGLGKLQ